jgi:hypothetical protein
MAQNDIANVSKTFTSFSEKVWTMDNNGNRTILYFHANGNLYKIYNAFAEINTWKYDILKNEINILNQNRSKYIVQEISSTRFCLQQIFQQEKLETACFINDINAKQDFESYFPQIQVSKDQEKTTVKQIEKTDFDTTKNENYEISLIGGGFYEAQNKISKNFIQITNDDWLISEFENQSSGLIKKTFKADKEEIQELLLFIGKKGFFNLQQNFNCTDNFCIKTQKEKTPIPLRLSVRYGQNYNIVQIAVYDYSNKHNFCNIPPNLKYIIDNILNFATIN